MVGRRAAVHQRRPLHVHRHAAVGRQRLRARVTAASCCSAAARRPARAPPRLPHLARRLRRRLAARRPRQRRLPADRHALHQGRDRGLHGPGRPVDHHHELRRGPRPQQGARRLHRHRRDRLLARPRHRRPAHRDRLALGVPAARPRRPRHPGRGDPARARPGPRPAGARRGFDLPGAATITAAMLLLVYTVVEAPDAGWAPPARSAVAGGRRRPAGRLRRDRAPHRPAARAARHPALGRARAGEPRRDGAVRRLGRLPVHRDAVHAAGCAAGRRSRPAWRSSPAA